MFGEDMKPDVELLLELTDGGMIVFDRVRKCHVRPTLKEVAAWTGRAYQTAYDYRSGRTNIPIDFWARLLERIDCPPIIGLLLSGRPDIEWWPRPEPLPADNRQALTQVLDAQADYHQTQVYLAELLRDGRIDEADAPTIHKYNGAYYQHRTSQAALHQAILNEFNRHQLGARS